MLFRWLRRKPIVHRVNLHHYNLHFRYISSTCFILEIPVLHHFLSCSTLRSDFKCLFTFLEHDYYMWIFTLQRIDVSGFKGLPTQVWEMVGSSKNSPEKPFISNFWESSCLKASRQCNAKIDFVKFVQKPR